MSSSCMYVMYSYVIMPKKKKEKRSNMNSEILVNDEIPTPAERASEWAAAVSGWAIYALDREIEDNR